MKKLAQKPASLFLTLCLLAVLTVPALAAEESLQGRIDATPAGGTVTLTANETITAPLTISKAITIDGGSATRYTINYTATADANAIRVNTNDAVTLKNMTIRAEKAGGRGVALDSSKPNFSMTNCLMSVHSRGIWVNPADTLAGTSITLTGTTIQNSQKPAAESYETWSTIGDTRGISLWDMTAANITIDNSNIYGFGYTINLSGNKDTNGVCSFGETMLTVRDSELFGWTAFNVWSSNTIFDITNSHLRGINLSTGSSDSYSTIVVNDDIYGIFEGATTEACKFNISGGIIDNYLPQSKIDAALAGNPVAVEFLFRIDREGVTEATFTQNVQFIDNSNLLYAAFRAGNQAPTEAFYNYVYGLDGSGRINPESYTSTYANGGILPLAVMPN